MAGRKTTPTLPISGEWVTIPRLLAQRANAYPNETAIEVPNSLGGKPYQLNAKSLWEDVQLLGRGLIALGIGRGDRIAIMGSTSLEWTLTDLAALSIGAIVVPIYESSSSDQIEWILSDAGVKIAFSDTTLQNEILSAHLGNSAAHCFENGALTFLRKNGEQIPQSAFDKRQQLQRSFDTATIIYTSGTTGRPKGAKLTHRNFANPVQAGHALLPEVIDAKTVRVLLFLPLAHVLGRFVQMITLTGHGVLAHSPNVKNLLTDIEQFKPTTLIAVPRVLEKIYNSADAKAGSGVKLKIFRSCAKIAIAYSRRKDKFLGPSPLLRFKHSCADRLVYRKIRNLLGGKVKYVVCGGAPLGARLGHFYRGIGITILEGYGLTETTGPIAISQPKTLRIGAVGQAVPGNEIKIADDGEIMVRGDSVTVGYWNNDQATAEVFENGWFYTGDLGSLDNKGRLTISGRKKEIIVTAGGKNVQPAILEDRLRAHPLISQVVVVGDNKPFVGALVTLDEAMLPTWLKNHSLPQMTLLEAARHGEVLAALERATKRANEAVSRAESIRAIRVLSTDFTEENGLLTPSLKVKRSAVMNRFAEVIADLYGQK